MNAIILTVIISIISLILAVVVAIALAPSYKIDESLGLNVFNQDINSALFILASDLVKAKRRENISLAALNATKTLNRCHKLIGEKIRKNLRLSDYETMIYNDYYKLSQLCREIVKNGEIPNLPQYNGKARVYLLAQFIVRFYHGELREEQIKNAVAIFNQTCALNYDETVVLPQVIGFCLIEYICAVCLRIINRERYRSLAQSDATYGNFHTSLVTSPEYITSFYAYASEKERVRADKILQDNGITLDSYTQLIAKKDELYHKIVCNSIKSVYSLSKILTEKLIQSFSLTDEILSEIPSYNRNSLRTKRHLCSLILRSSIKKKKSEIALAYEVVGRCKASGISVSEVLLNYSKSKWCERAYALAQLTITVVFCAVISGILPPNFIAQAVATLTVFLIVVKITDHFALRLTEQRFVPDIDENKIESSALVVKTVVLSSVSEVKKAFFNLKVVAHSNPNEKLAYGLLIDLPTAKMPTSALDDEIIEQIKTEYQSLDGKFNIFVRRRVKSKSGLYYGYERKRGAIMALNGLILRNEDEQFSLILGNSYRHKFVIALDSDSEIRSAHRLIGYMEHPYASEVAIMSTRATTMPHSANKTPFSRLFCDEGGEQNYAFRHDDTHFALFNKGNYTGKGIYSVEKFDRKLNGFFPDERILSHDYIEGAVAGCINAPVNIYDETPTTFSRNLSRRLRWTRGDFQLLPYLFNKVTLKNGEKRKNPISPINKWRILLNMIFSLEPLFSLALFYFSAIYFSPILVLLALSPQIIATALSLPKVCKSIKIGLYSLITLPSVAVTLTKGVLITLIRLIKNEKLLEWTISSNDRADKDYGLVQVLSAITLVIVNTLFSLNPISYAIASLWGVGGALINLCDEPYKKRKVSPQSRSYMQLIAERTWKFFEKSVNASTNYLPPDHYDERAEKGYAYRTSPTNIGMYLVAVFCAYKLNIITQNQAKARITDTIKVVEKLEKFNGNLYNWYDIKSLAPLPPRYLSFVDSGNFICSLMLAKSICDDDTIKSIDTIIQKTDFAFYYDEKSGLCSVGYNTQNCSYDSPYDLLASESLISYLTCIALNKLPESVFYSLSDKRYRAQGNTLVSWTGGAFEYLLTPQFFRYERSTELYTSAINSIKAQKYLAKKCGRSIWGVSECQHKIKEDNDDYGYKAFGVESIALSPSVTHDAVSLYGGALTLPFDCDGETLLCEYANKNLIGKYGLYESVDEITIKTYMAHHQGMIMLAIANTLLDNIVINHLRSYPQIVSLDILLAKTLNNSDCEKVGAHREVSLSQGWEKKITKKLAYEEYATYSSDNYTFVLGSEGSEFSTINKTELTRKRKGTGMRILAKNEEFSLDLLRAREVVFAPSHAKYISENALIRCETSIYPVSVFSGGRVIKINLISKCSEKINLGISYAQTPTLTNHDSDLSHEEFATMDIFSEEKFGGVYATKDELDFVYFTKCLSCDCAHNLTSRAQFNCNYDDYDCPYQLNTLLASEQNLTLLHRQKTTVVFVSTVINKKSFTQKNIAKNLQINELVLCETKSNYARRFSQLSSILADIGSIKTDALNSHFNTRYPIVSLTARSLRSLDKINDEIFSLSAVAKSGVRFNLALIYHETNIYFTPLLDGLKYIVARHKLSEYLTGGVIRYINEVTDFSLSELTAMNSLPPALKNHEIITQMRSLSPPKNSAELEKEKIVNKQGLGGFTQNGDYYLFGDELNTPNPWCNIISNGLVGSLTTVNGEGYTFIGNAQLNKITDFSNKNNGEFVLLCEGDEIWSVSKSPILKNANYDLTFSPNKTRYRCGYNDTVSSLTHFVGGGKSKYLMISIENKSVKERTISVALVLTLAMEQNAEYGVSALNYRVEENRIYMENSATNFSAFVTCSEKLTDYAFSLSACKNNRGEIVKLYNADKTVKGNEIVFVSTVKLGKMSTKTLCFALSGNENLDIGAFNLAYDESEKRRINLSPITIEKGLNDIKNLYAWLPSQALYCRFFARCGYYQTSGAYGFRDQLQDCMAIVYFNPQLVRKHILLCAGAQFIQGDVLHWFFEDYRGVRSNYSDDKLFLVWTTVEYINHTGDYSILSEQVPYLNDKVAKYGEYRKYETTANYEPLINHLIRAIDSVEYGKNSLAKMLGGDWNDGLSAVGKSGEGESVFTTMLNYLCIRKILPFVSESKRSEYAKLSVKLASAVNDFYFNGYYARAVCSDGKILGTKDCDSCKIDLLVQAFSVISGIAPPERASSALEIASKMLYDEKSQTLNLLSPPFYKRDEKIGYITKYPPFVRENGAQYTHAAVWFITACYRANKSELGEKLFSVINPTEKTKTKNGVMRYKTEPFVMSADVYGGPYNGAGGWSWYTGAGAWTYKLITEQIIGVKISGDTISFNPNLPTRTEQAQIKLKTAKCTLSVVIDNRNNGGEWTIAWGKLNFNGNKIKLSEKLNGATLTLKRA